MKKIILFFIFWFFLTGTALAQAKSLTLTDCYKLALKRSELIAIDGELIKEAEAHFLQAFGTLLPHVSFSVDQDFGGPNSAVSRGSVSKFVFTQTLFSGFKELAGVKASEFEKTKRKDEKIRAEQLLFVDVSDSFYLLFEIREELKTLDVVSSALKGRIKELLGRERLGRSRRSEVVNTQAQLYSLDADMELLKSQETIARQLLEFLIGTDVSSIEDDGKIVESLKPESEYLAKAQARYDVLAAEAAWELAKRNIIVARSGFFPAINLSSNYYVQRTIVPKDKGWDATLSVDVPIFQGTETIGALKLAQAQANASELLWIRTQRAAIYNIKNAYAKFKFSVTIKNALKKVLSATEMNYALQTEDYRRNLVSNLDVLAAIQGLEGARRNYVHGFYNTKRFYWQLLVSIGEIS